MPRLIHLNGASRVGKSTPARRYAAEHPGRPNAILIDTSTLGAEQTYLRIIAAGGDS